MNPGKTGTKAAAHYELRVPARASQVLRLRLSADSPGTAAPTGGATRFGVAFDEIVSARLKEADKFYASVVPPSLTADQDNVMRQAGRHALVEAVLQLRR